MKRYTRASKAAAARARAIMDRGFIFTALQQPRDSGLRATCISTGRCTTRLLSYIAHLQAQRRHARQRRIPIARELYSRASCFMTAAAARHIEQAEIKKIYIKYINPLLIGPPF